MSGPSALRQGCPDHRASSGLNASRLAGVGHLFEVQLDATGVVVAELILQVLDDPRLQRAGQLAPGLALVLATLLAVTAEVRKPAVGGAESRPLVGLARLAGLLLLRLSQRLRRLLQRLRR